MSEDEKRLFICNGQPIKFFMGLEFQKKEFTAWCKKIERYGGIVAYEIDLDSVNLTKLKENHENDCNFLWYDAQFIDDCIENNVLLHIRDYRVDKQTPGQIKAERRFLAAADESFQEESSSTHPETLDESSEVPDQSPEISEDESTPFETPDEFPPIPQNESPLPETQDESPAELDKLELQAKVVLERLTEDQLQKFLRKKQKNLSSPSKKKSNSHGKTPKKGIKVVNIETLSNSQYSSLITPLKKRVSPVENQINLSRNENTINSTMNKNDLSELRDESPARRNSIDNNLNSSPDSPRILPQELATNFDDSEEEIFISPVNKGQGKSKSPSPKTKLLNSSQCGERILYGFKVREVPMRVSSSDEEIETGRAKSSARKASKKRSENILTLDEDETSQSETEDNPPAVSPCKKKTLFKTVYADIIRK